MDAQVFCTSWRVRYYKDFDRNIFSKSITDVQSQAGTHIDFGAHYFLRNNGRLLSKALLIMMIKHIAQSVFNS